MRWNTTTCFAIDVQFEDIDGGGVVHHPNYLRYLERARCHAMREMGVPFDECLKDGIAFVVAEMNVRYLRPLQFGQRIFVLTRLVAVRKSSLKVFQKILLDPPEHPEKHDHDNFFTTATDTSFFAQVRLVAVELKSGRPIPLPDNIRLAAQCPSQEELLGASPCADVRLHSYSHGGL